MARFYNTASGSPIDYMYRVPGEMMMNVLQFNEAQNDMIYDQASLLNDALAQVKYLNPDEGKVKELTSQYNQEVDNISNKLREDPLSWRRLNPNIRDLGRKIHTDFTTGDLGKIQANYNAYQEYDKYISDLEKAGKLSPQTGQIFRSTALNNYTGFTDPNTGSYRAFNAERPMEDMDLNKWMDDQLKNLEASGQVQWNEQAGDYFIKTESGWEAITQEKIMNTLLPAIQADNNLLSYLGQRQRYGIMSNIFDEQGNLQLVNSDGKFINNPLTNAVMAAANEHSFFKSKSGTSLRSNPLANQNYANMYDWQKTVTQRDWDLEDVASEREYNDKLLDDERNWKAYQEAMKDPAMMERYKNLATTKGTTGNPYIDADLGVYNTQFTQGYRGIQANPYAGENQVSWDVANNLSKATDAGLLEVRSQLKNDPNNKALLEKEQELMRNQTYWNGVREKALEDVQNSDYWRGDNYDFYKQMRSGGFNFAQDQLAAIESAIRNHNLISGSSSNLDDMVSLNNLQDPLGNRLEMRGVMRSRTGQDYISMRELQSMKSELEQRVKRYNTLDTKYKKDLDDNLRTNSKLTSTFLTVKPLDRDLSGMLYSSIIGNPESYNIIDPTTGDINRSEVRSGSSWTRALGPMGRLFENNNPLTFEGTGKNILNYYQEKGMNPQENIIIEGVTPPDYKGQSVAVMRFQNAKGVDPNKRFIVPLPSGFQNQLGKELQVSDDKDLSQLGSSMLDNNKRIISQQLRSYKTHSTGIGKSSVPLEFNIADNVNGKIEYLPIKVTPIKKDNPLDAGFNYKVETYNSNSGQWRDEGTYPDVESVQNILTN